MKKWLLLVGLLCSLPLRGQDYIRRDYYGEGATQDAAMTALMTRIGRAVSFENPVLLNTYRADIGKAVIEEKRNGNVVLSLSGTVLDQVFQTRQNRAAGIVDQGRRSRDDAVKKTYFNWAWYYLSSLPEGHRIPGKEEIRNWLLAHKDLPMGSLPVSMTHIEREAASIRALIGDWATVAGKTLPTTLPGKTLPAAQDSAPPQRPALKALRAAPIAYYPLAVPDFPPLISRSQTPLPEVVPVQTLLIATIGWAPEPVFGAVVAAHRKWGAAATFQSNFTKVGSSYEAFSDGTRTDGGYLWPEGGSRVSLLSVSAGASYALLPWLSGYFTAGYGYRTVCWKDSEGEWARIQDISARGVYFSAGALLGWKHLAGTVALSTVAFQTMGITLGLGVRF